MLSDYGIALASIGGAHSDTSDTSGQPKIGTPLYIPPEALISRTVHPVKHNMWSLGVVAWEMVSNSYPWWLDHEVVTTRDLMEATKRTTKGGFPKDLNMSDEMYEFIVNGVCPVEERLTPSQATKLPFFEGIDFNHSELFPEGRAMDELKDVEQI